MDSASGRISDRSKAAAKARLPSDGDPRRRAETKPEKKCFPKREDMPLQDFVKEKTKTIPPTTKKTEQLSEKKSDVHGGDFSGVTQFAQPVDCGYAARVRAAYQTLCFLVWVAGRDPSAGSVPAETAAQYMITWLGQAHKA